MLVQLQIYVYAALGAFVNFLITRYSHDLVQGLDIFIDEISRDITIRMIIFIVLSVLLGSVISVAMIGPTSDRQALVAGMALTSSLSLITPKSKTKPRAGQGG